MSKSIAFLSHSFLKRDKKTCNWFKKILDDYFDVLTAGKPEPDYLMKKVIPKINKSEYFVALLCKRARVIDDKDEITDSFISSPWIYSELGYAIAKDKKILIFVEEGVHHKGMYPTDFEIIEVNIKKLKQHDKDVRGYIQKAIEKYSQSKEIKSLIVEEIRKVIIAYADGHTETEIITKMRILNDNVKQLSESGFGLMNSKGRIIFFNKLSSPKEIRRRRQINTISFTELSENLKDCRIDLQKSPDKRNQFLIFPKNNLKTGDIVEYGVGVSAKDIFNDYKNNQKESTVHEIKDETDKLMLILNLECNMLIKEKPKLYVYDNRGNIMKKVIIPPEQSYSTYFKIFKWELSKNQINIGYRYEITWKRI